MQHVNVGRILEEMIPFLTLVLGLILGHRSGSRLAAEQRFEDRLQRWKERRQDLLVQLQRQAHRGRGSGNCDDVSQYRRGR